MPSQHQPVGWITVGLLVIVVAAGCSQFGPQLNIDVENEGLAKVTVTVDSSGPGRTDGEDVVIPHGEGSAWSVPLGSTWEIRINGKHVIGSGDQTDLAHPSPGHVQDVNICIRVTPDGALKLDDGCWVGATTQPGPSG
jgi:hypothetical protein